MKKIKKTVFFFLMLFWVSFSATAQFPRFKILAFYSKNVEQAHVEFAEEAIHFFKDLTSGEGLVFDTTSNMADMNADKLKGYQLVMMLNNSIQDNDQRNVFQQYMENGGGWYGFHVAAYNDRDTHWPWFLEFLGGGVFYRNNWPSMPAKLVVDAPKHPVNKGMPSTFISPANEWYQWKPSPREQKNIQVLLSLSSENYPFGLKDIVPDGDFPVVWTNTGYRMIYLNMGHGKGIFSDATQNYLIINALRWIIASDKQGNVFER